MARGKNEIRHVSDLPDWFRLDKYDAAESLDTAGWFEQLSVRSQCFLLLRNATRSVGWAEDLPPLAAEQHNAHRNTQENEGLDLDEDECVALSEVRSNPIVDLFKSVELRPLFLGGAVYELKIKKEKPLYSLGVHSMTVRQLRLHEVHMTPSRVAYSRRWAKGVFRALGSGDDVYPHKNWIDCPVQESFRLDDRLVIGEDGVTCRRVLERRRESETAVMINLDLPDSILIDSFRQWLKSARFDTKTTAAAKRYRKPDFDSWVRLGILPFLDLTIWAIETGVSIPNRVMADAIFHPGEGGEEVVRKTTEPTALKLVDERDSEGMAPLDALCAQAALELAGQFDAKAEESDT